MKKQLFFSMVLACAISTGFAQSVNVINLKKYKLQVTMLGSMKSNGEERQLKVRLCDERLISPELRKEIEQKGAENIPEEELWLTLPYTAFESQHEGTSFFVAYVPFSAEFNNDYLKIFD